jgi:hypothetical protein
MKEKKRGKDETKNRAEGSRSGAEESSQPDSPKESASSSTCEGDSSTQEVRRLKRPGHGRKAALDYPGARLVRLNHPDMAPGDPCPESGCEGHPHQLERANVKIYLTGRHLISATKYERPVLRCSDCFNRRPKPIPALPTAQARLFPHRTIWPNSSWHCLTERSCQRRASTR